MSQNAVEPNSDAPIDLHSLSDAALAALALRRLQTVTPIECRDRGMVPPFLAIAIAPGPQILCTLQEFGADGAPTNNHLFGRLGDEFRVPLTIVVVDSLGERWMAAVTRPAPVQKQSPKRASPQPGKSDSKATS